MTQPTDYYAAPANRAEPGVLVLHAWWGLNDTIRAMCGRLAEAGFCAYAPDLYHGELADTVAGAEALAQALDGERARADIRQAVDWLGRGQETLDQQGQETFDQQGSGSGDPRPAGLAVIGFSLGAYFALELANADPERIRAVVVFYGTGPEDFAKSKAAFLGHFAENDPFEPPENLDHLASCLRQAGRPFTFHVYSGTGHWFCEPDRLDAFDRAAADLAWERTLAFLNENLPGS